MASWQAHAADALIRVTVKRALRGKPDIAQARAALGSGKLPPPPGIRFESGTLGGVACEFPRAEATPTGITLLYLHGGGYIACSPATHRPITGFYARAGFDVVAPDYRKAPEHPFPAAVDDAEAVYRTLLARGTPAERIVVSGDSAGGGLALALMLRLRERGLPLPAGAALFSPWTDLATTGESIRANAARDAMFPAEGFGAGAAFYLGGTDARAPLASPLYADPAGLPPLLIHVGEREMLRDDSTRFAARAREAGVAVALTVWDVVPHVWQLLPHFVPEARQSLREAAAFLIAAAGRAPAPAPLHATAEA